MKSCQRVLSSLAVSAGFAAVTLLPSIAVAQLHYRLAPESTFEAGCFAPCLCPVMIRSGVSGTFVAVPLEPDGSYQVFAIREVQWDVPGPALFVRGSGTYRIDTAALVQRLELDLQVGDDPVEHYDSGLVPAKAKFPDIDVVISVHGMVCRDTVFGVQARFVPGGPPRSRNGLDVAAALSARRAAPPTAPAVALATVRKSPLAAPNTWSAVKSLYRDSKP
jgi:hypothetical protein